MNRTFSRDKLEGIIAVAAAASASDDEEDDDDLLQAVEGRRVGCRLRQRQ